MKWISECERCGKRKTVFKNDIIHKCGCGNLMTPLTLKLIEKGEMIKKSETIDSIRKRVLKQVRYLDV